MALNGLLTLASLGLFILLAELLLFRFVLQPGDAPQNSFSEGLLRYAPNQQGTWRVGDDVAAAYRINAQGWNSGHESYALKKSENVRRIAIIGDSYVEALQVPYAQSLAEQLERSGNGRDQVYRFGISGAPLSHYLAMARHVAQTYHPDMIVLVLLHNDFDESFNVVAGRYTSSFQKFRMEANQVTEEIAPVPYRATWSDWVRQTATVRYLYYRQRITPSSLLARFRSSATIYQANVDSAAVSALRAPIRGATDYAFDQLALLSQRYGFKLLLLMDGDRQAIYADADAVNLYEHGALWLNHMAAEAARQAGVPFIDLHPRFAGEWRQYGQKFNSTSDNHWNENGHRVAAQALREYLTQ